MLDIKHIEPFILSVALNRPDLHNAFNAELVAQLTETFAQLADDDSVRAVILWGHGKSFSAGGDLNWMKQAASFTHAENLADARALAHMLETLNRCPKPVITIAHGAVMGGGVGLTSVSDIVIAVEGVKFALSEVKLGLTPATISPYVIRAMGASHARRYFTTAEIFGTDTALSTGLAHETAAHTDGAHALALKLARKITANAPGAVSAAKALVLDFDGRSITPKLTLDSAERIAERRASVEAQEGIAAFFEKRTPAWQQDLSSANNEGDGA